MIFLFSIIFLLGWVPKSVIRGHDNKIFLLDFFGSEKLRGSGLTVPQNRFLTAFGSPWNTFLGFYIKKERVDRLLADKALRKQQQGQQHLQTAPRGVIWGKDPNHFEGNADMLRSVANSVHLVSTTRPIFSHANIEWLGHQTGDQWRELLASSKFLIGLGNPLLGPSAIDAVVAGCVYLNPQFIVPMRDVYYSQHPYAADKIGKPYVCSFHQSNAAELDACVQYALKADLDPFLPPDFTFEAYLLRVKAIFDL